MPECPAVESSAAARIYTSPIITPVRMSSGILPVTVRLPTPPSASVSAVLSSVRLPLSSATRTVQVAVLPFLLVAVMLAAPSFLAETSPPLTVATDVSELDQVTDLSVAVAGYTDASSEKL